MDADLEEAGDYDIYAIVDFGDGLVVSVAVDFGDFGGFLFGEGFEEVLGLGDELFGVGGGVIWDDDEEGFIHDVGFLRENVYEVNIVIHEDAEEHVVGVATDFGELF